MRFIKTPVGKVHFASIPFILFNTVTGFLTLMNMDIGFLMQFHGKSGMLIFLAPLIVLLFQKNRMNMLKSFINMSFNVRIPLKKKNYLGVSFKLNNLLMLCTILALGFTGIVMETGLLLPVSLAYAIHQAAMWGMIIFVVLHVTLGAFIHLKSHPTVKKLTY